MNGAAHGGPSRVEHFIWKAPPAARTVWLLAFAGVSFFVPMLADRWAYDHLFVRNVYDADWARFLRELGWLPTWIIAAFAVWLTTRRPGADPAQPPRAMPIAAGSRAVYLALAPAASGIVCEVLKLLIRRQRPEVGAGDYVFRAWSDHTFSTGGLATPSSHTMVAFAAATALARIFPGARWLWYALAAGTAVTRVMAHAHFVSDVTLGALLGWSVGWGVWIAMHRRTAATPGPTTQ